MKKVIVRILVLFLVVFTINQVLHKAMIPYDWADLALHTKNNYYKEHKQDFNIAFVGGSLFYRHIDPSSFDSLNRAYGIQTSSFNFGVDGNNHIKQMILINRLLNDDDNQLDYLFFALSSDAYFEKRNMHTRKFVTWVDWPSLKYAIGVSMHSDATLGARLKLCYKYTLTWFENKVNAGMGIFLLKMMNRNNKSETANNQIALHLGAEKNGFKPYNYDADVDSASLSHEDRILFWSNNHFKRNTGVMDSINSLYIDDFTTYKKGEGHTNQYMFNSYMELISKAEEKGVRLIVLLPPRSRLTYKMFLPLYDKLPDGNKLNMASILTYPEFYTYSSTFNFYHMNKKGAEMFSSALSQEFLKLNEIEADFYDPDTAGVYILHQ